MLDIPQIKENDALRNKKNFLILKYCLKNWRNRKKSTVTVFLLNLNNKYGEIR